MKKVLLLCLLFASVNVSAAREFRRLSCAKENGGLGAKTITINYSEDRDSNIGSVQSLVFSDYPDLESGVQTVKLTDLFNEIKVNLGDFAVRAVRVIEDEALSKHVLLVSHNGDDGLYAGYYSCKYEKIYPFTPQTH